METGDLFIITPEAQIKWGEVFSTRSPLSIWMDMAAPIRKPSDAIIYTLRDATGITGSSTVSFPDNIDLSPIDQLKTLGVLQSDHVSADKARRILQTFQFKIYNLNDDKNFFTLEFIRSLSDQEAQFALAYVYTLAKIRNLPVAEIANNPDGRALPAISDPNAQVRNELVSQFTEYTEELAAKARRIAPIIRKGTLNAGLKLKKDWSTKVGMTQTEIDGLVGRLNQGQPAYYLK